jgi:multidrug efflux system membrane fusion protein
MLAAAVLGGCEKTDGAAKAVVPPNRPVPVLVGTAQTRDVPLEIATFGRVQALSTVVIKSQVTGVIQAAFFRKGDEVKKDQKLFELDQRPLRAALQQLEANKGRDEAQLRNARKELARQTELLKKGIASQAEYDKAEADEAAFSAIVKADEAAIDNAKVQLSYCTIVSPIDARAGDLAVDVGNLVKANDVDIVTLAQIRPIEVVFSIPQRDLPAVRKYKDAGPLKVLATIPGSGEPAEEGAVTFIDNTVSPTSGTIKLIATFTNEKEKLWPGLYVDVALSMTVQKGATVVPSQAVQSGRDGRYVFVIGEDAKGEKTAEVRAVTVSRTTAGLAIVESGLKAGEQVVTDGQVRLLPGAKVSIRKDLLDAGPKPGEATTKPR